MKKRIILISSLIILLIIYFGFKGFYLIYYNVSSNLKNSFDISNTITIKNKNVQSDDYFEFQNMKIRNDFKNYKKLDSNIEINTISPKLVLKDKNGNTIKAFWMGKADTYVYMLKTDKTLFGVNDSRITTTNLTHILEKNNINDDIELFEYLSNQRNIKNNIFTSIRKMKENFAIYNIISIIMPAIKSITLINGEYQGYICNFNNNINEVSILKNNKRYVFVFMDKTNLTDEYLTDILVTIIID